MTTPAQATNGVQRYQLFVGNRWEEAESGNALDSVNPATGTVWARVPEGNAPDVDRAVRAARQAFDEDPWGRMNGMERGRYLIRLAYLLMERAEHFAELETRDNGKAIRETRAEMKWVAETFEYFGGLASKLHGETIPAPGTFFVYTLREPVGVVGAIIPWNSPMIMLAMKVAPALAAGNTVVLKPAEQTPVTALEFCKLSLEVGLPPGVLNVVPGFGPTAGAALVRHPGVDKLAFTGEYTTGMLIAEQAAKTLKPVSLELGGKSPNIVFEDADLDEAVKGSAFGIFSAAGQFCMAGSRILLQQKIYDEFLDRLVTKAKSVRVGDPMDPRTHMGAQTSQEQLDKIKRYVAIGQKEGAELRCGGRPPEDPALAQGFFFTPTVFAKVDNRMRIAQEEIFGPVVSIVPFRDAEEAVRLGNDTIFGLAGAVWTRDVKRAHEMARRINCGTFWINTYRKVSYMAPFGGNKMSGYGRENGIHCMEMFTKLKSVFVELADQTPDWFS